MAEAGMLFVERARALTRDFTVLPNQTSALASLLRRLDGNPLAIELAAARVRAMTVESIEARLDDQFRLLIGGPRGAPHRQQTLRATIDWSYDLLTEPERCLYRRLAVFAGGWSLEAAEAVCSGGEAEDWEVMDLQMALLDKSLVASDERDNHTRMRMLEAIRQYARNRLVESGEREAVSDRHRDYYLSLAEEAEPQLSGPQQVDWFRRLEAEHDNLRAALERSLAAAAPLHALRFCTAIARFWSTRGYLSEGLGFCMRALQQSDGTDASKERAFTLCAAAVLSRMQGDVASAETRFQEALTIFRAIGFSLGAATSLNGMGTCAQERGQLSIARAYLEESLAIRREIQDRRGTAATLQNLGTLALEQGDRDAARRFYEDALALAQEIGDIRGRAVSLLHLGLLASLGAEFEEARSRITQSMVIRRELGDRGGVANALHNLAEVDLAEGLPESARERLQEALATRRTIGDRAGIANSLLGLGRVGLRERDIVRARESLSEAVRSFVQLGNMNGVLSSLEELAHLAVENGEPDGAVSVLGAIASLRGASGASLTVGAGHDKEISVPSLRETLGKERFAQAWTRGRGLTLDQAVALALTAIADQSEEETVFNYKPRRQG